MPRYIDADALKPDYIIGSTSTNTECYRYVSLKQIVNAPIADVVERKVGKWKLNKDGNWACPFCEFDPYHDNMKGMNYCPNCGAQMDERREDDND